MRVVLTHIGTMGDVHPLIALALELQRRGHEAVLAVPEVFRERVRPLGIDFHAVRPDIDPQDTALAAKIYEPRRGTEYGLREFLFPALRESYDDLMAAVSAPRRPAGGRRAELCRAAGGGNDQDRVGQRGARADQFLFGL